MDLRKHEGVHPRVGAVDVVPLVPIAPSMAFMSASTSPSPVPSEERRSPSVLTTVTRALGAAPEAPEKANSSRRQPPSASTRISSESRASRSSAVTRPFLSATSLKRPKTTVSSSRSSS